MTAIICLGVVQFLILAAWIYTQREDRKQIDRLLDRVQAPEAVQAAVVERLMNGRDAPIFNEPPLEMYGDPMHPSADVALQEMIGD